MSIAGFQQALSDLIASPQRCLRLRAGDQAGLEGYELSERERRRLAAVVLQPGMSVSCSIYRANRLTPIAGGLPCSCTALGDALPAEIEAFWAAEATDMQFGREVERFGRFLGERLRSGGLECRYLDEVLSFELALNRLRHEEGASTVRFAHDPVPLLEALTEGRVPGAVATGSYEVVLEANAGDIRVWVASESGTASG